MVGYIDQYGEKNMEVTEGYQRMKISDNNFL